MRLFLALAFALAPVFASAQQPTQAPTHEYFAGPTLGMTYTSTCTATGATPQTCNATKGAVTTGSLTTAALTAASYVINNNLATAASIVSCDLAAYSGTFFTAGTPAIGSCTPGAGTITVTILNLHATVALAGTLTINFAIID